ncbi:hypothetical protein [Solimonas flava]|uniref:hypothetical protein n=1 Tax=Solimonas flava TaxID=415849 RepID=UPI000A039951|nr:hypothetical protein [Solimonas flava]
MQENRLSHLLSLLPLVTAGSYFFGLVYYQAYMGQLGIEESLIQLSFHRTLFQGCVALIGVGLPGLLYALIAAELIYFGSELVLLLASRERVAKLLARIRAKLKIESKKVVDPANATSDFSKLSFRMFLITGAIFSIVVLLLLIGLTADKSGRAAAEKFIQRAEDGKVAFKEVWVKGDEKPVIGIPMGCGEAFCAFRMAHASILIAQGDIARISPIASTSAGRNE